VLTNRILRFLQEKSVKEPEQFGEFYRDYGLFLKEGIVTGQQQNDKVHLNQFVFESFTIFGLQEEISKLLRFESSANKSGERVTLPEYCNRMKKDQRDIYYLAAPR
jgi:TNF receptor-associated protein 1